MFYTQVTRKLKIFHQNLIQASIDSNWAINNVYLKSVFSLHPYFLIKKNITNTNTPKLSVPNPNGPCAELSTIQTRKEQIVYLTFLLAVALPLPLHPSMFLVALVSSMVESLVHLPPLGALL